MELAPSTEVANLRARLWGAGFRPIAVLSGDKRPLAPQWTESARQDPPECVRLGAVPHALNTGILCDGLRAVDFDIDDPVAARRCQALAEAMLGAGPVRWRANSARCLILYRAAEGSPRKVVLAGALGKIEVLGRGQQFVAFGRHPSGATLSWSPEAPGDVGLPALPVVTEAALQAFLAACAPIIEAELPEWENGQDRTSGTPQAELLRVAAALHVIPNGGEPADWEAWNRIGMAVWAATGGSEFGFAAFDAWSGRHPAYDPAETRARWEHYRTSPPSQIGAGTLFRLAKAARDGQQQHQREPPPQQPDARLGIWDASSIDAAKIPPRGWLLSNSFCRRFLSSLIADGGVGKTALRIAQAVALATGRELTGEHIFVRPCRVLLVSFEDDKDELDRRVAAVLKHYGIPPDEVTGRLFLAAPKGIKLLELKEGALRSGALRTWLEDAIAAYRPDLLVLDPFVKTHALNENDNNQMDMVCDDLAALAIEHDIAIDAPHHTRKGVQSPGDADAGRGASATKDATRISDTLTPMSEDEAARFGIEHHERTSYVRFDSAKHNLAPARQAKWFRLVSVPLGNASETYPSGDHVQAVVVWQPPGLWDYIDTATLNRVLDQISAGLPSGSRYSDAPAATERAAWRVIVEFLPERTEPQAREMIRTWVKNGLLVSEEYDDANDRKVRKGLRVVAVKRPT